MNKTKIRRQFTVKDCVITGLCESGTVFTAKCKASVETRTQEKILRTKFGAEYIVAQMEYGLVIGKNPDTDVTFESIEGVESYRAVFTFHMPYSEDKYYIIDNIIPVRIDLDGDWTFKISDEAGEELCNMHEAAR